MACRCVSRFDHHCPAISNCVGKGNQRAYSAWLALLLLAQLLFLHLAALFCARTARHHWGATGQHDRGGFMDVLPGLWLIFRLHPGKLLLIVIEVGRAACLLICLSACLPVAHMYVCASVCPSLHLSICPQDPGSRGAEHRCRMLQPSSCACLLMSLFLWDFSGCSSISLLYLLLQCVNAPSCTVPVECECKHPSALQSSSSMQTVLSSSSRNVV